MYSLLGNQDDIISSLLSNKECENTKANTSPFWMDVSYRLYTQCITVHVAICGYLIASNCNRNAHLHMCVYPCSFKFHIHMYHSGIALKQLLILYY